MGSFLSAAAWFAVPFGLLFGAVAGWLLYQGRHPELSRLRIVTHHEDPEQPPVRIVITGRKDEQ